MFGKTHWVYEGTVMQTGMTCQPTSQAYVENIPDSGWVRCLGHFPKQTDLILFE